jgi:hypothetical protein
MAWRLVRSLEMLRNQINAAAPNRNKRNDGTIGDAAHSARTSDHNAESDGTVDAIDITHDPAHGVDCHKIAKALVDSRDPRIKYLIWNRHICSSTVAPWTWRPSNGHTEHIHISVNDWNQDDTSPWALGLATSPPPEIEPPPGPTKPILKRGSVGPDVIELQARLAVTIDGLFGKKTESAVKAFQTNRGLIADGIVGPRTWAALGNKG